MTKEINMASNDWVRQLQEIVGNCTINLITSDNVLKVRSKELGNIHLTVGSVDGEVHNIQLTTKFFHKNMEEVRKLYELLGQIVIDYDFNKGLTKGKQG